MNTLLTLIKLAVQAHVAFTVSYTNVQYIDDQVCGVNQTVSVEAYQPDEAVVICKPVNGVYRLVVITQ